MNIEKLIKQFHYHYALRGWDKEFEINKNSWLRAYGESDYTCLKEGLLAWIDAQGGKFLKAPLPADIRPYYTQGMEKVRALERRNDKPQGIYAKVFNSKINFALVGDAELNQSAQLILKFREQKSYEKAKEKCPMYAISQSIVEEYGRRFA